MLNPRVLYQIHPDAEHTHKAKAKTNQENRKGGRERKSLFMASWLPSSFLRFLCPDSSSVAFHQSEHVFHRSLESHKHGTRDDRVSDVQLHQMRDLVDQCHVPVVDPVPGVNLEL